VPRRNDVVDDRNDVVVSPDVRRDNRLPPSQVQVRSKKWPVLDAGGPPDMDSVEWCFEIGGLVESPIRWTWQEFQQLPRVKVLADFHCVTRWSRLDNLWEGVSTREVLSHVVVSPAVRYVLVHAYDSHCGTHWSTNMPLEAFTAEDVLFAATHDGVPLSLEHGGPLRLVVPRLYAWKSAKWVRGIELMAEDRAGYWEEGGYHMNGDPWSEQRLR
jgi:DMSO/TMAO reductase YedYZ molybdopterin-dependent catalytic subunit